METKSSPREMMRMEMEPAGHLRHRDAVVKGGREESRPGPAICLSRGGRCFRRRFLRTAGRIFKLDVDQAGFCHGRPAMSPKRDLSRPKEATSRMSIAISSFVAGPARRFGGDRFERRDLRLDSPGLIIDHDAVPGDPGHEAAADQGAGAPMP